jgi:O-antigen ligase
MRYIPPDVIQMIQQGGMYRINSAAHRLIIWQFVGERIAERPLLGWGLDSSRAIPGGHDTVQSFSERLPLHPHNAALQLWLELGVLGGMLGAFIVAWPALRIDRALARGAPQAVAVGLVAATAVVALLGFGIWQSWWVATLGLVSMCAVAILPSSAPDS